MEVMIVNFLPEAQNYDRELRKGFFRRFQKNNISELWPSIKMRR